MECILVYDVAAEFGGALSVLNDYFAQAIKDTNNKYVFVVSINDLSETKNVEVISLPWVKKSWLHRLYCDYYYIQKIIVNKKIDKILSLQNISVPNTNIFQTVFIHNAIPFTTYKFKLTKDPYLWVYQNIIGAMIVKSIKQCERVIVQTNWMKNIITNVCQVEGSKIEVKPFLVHGERTERMNVSNNVFFYPASALSFKNHKLIIEACKKVPHSLNYRIVLTIDKNTNRITRYLAKETMLNNLPIDFIGQITKERVNDFYKKTVLLFPSVLETVGLPLVEAQQYSCPILAADCEYAHEAIGSYELVNYFNPYSSDDLAEKIIQLVKNR